MQEHVINCGTSPPGVLEADKMLIKPDGLLCSYSSETCTLCNLKWRHYVIDGEGFGKTSGIVLDRSKNRVSSSRKYILCIFWHMGHTCLDIKEDNILE